VFHPSMIFVRHWKPRTSNPSGLCIAPHLLGTCNPDFNPCHGRHRGSPFDGHFGHLQGILEGIACELANMTELLQRVAGSFSDLYVTAADAARILALSCALP